MMIPCFDKSIWQRCGGVDGAEPYTEYNETMKVCKVYVDADRVPSWETFHREAEKAVQACVMRENPLSGELYEATGTKNIKGSPAYLFETFGDSAETIIWINALCPDSEQFYMALADAKAYRSAYQKKLDEMGVVGKFYLEEVPGTLYDSRKLHRTNSQKQTDWILKGMGVQI